MLMNRMDRRGAMLRALGSVVVAGGLGGLLAGCSDKAAAPSFTSVDVTGADYARDFSMPDQNGRVRTMKDFAGKVVVIFFGFTHCPDVCPTTLAEMAQIKKLLGDDGDKLQGIFVTVDPERDTPEVLKAYVANFDPGFIALRADTPEQLAAMAKDYKVYYKKVEGSTPGAYSMDHSAGSYIYDPQGRLRLFSRYGSGADKLAGDIRQLLHAAG